MRRILEIAVIFMGTLGFWGFVYPELCLTEETCRVAEAEGNESGKEWVEAYQDVYGFLNDSGETRIKWKSIEYLYQVKEKIDGKKD